MSEHTLDDTIDVVLYISGIVATVLFVVGVVAFVIWVIAFQGLQN